MDLSGKSDVVARVCRALSRGDIAQAGNTIEADYPFEFVPRKRPSISKKRALRLFVRDHFCDRYTGQRLLFPPVLAVVTHALPALFPSHSNWKMSETHQAYWELSPMLDHVEPFARGGSNDDDNLVTTSPVINAKKSLFAPEEVGLRLIAPEDLPNWDGLLGWFMDYVDSHPTILTAKVPGTPIKSWHEAARQLLAEEDGLSHHLGR